MFSSERLKGIDVFVCVSDSGSFKAAAERMNLTASAVSKGIARLESRLQVRLFNPFQPLGVYAVAAGSVERGKQTAALRIRQGFGRLYIQLPDRQQPGARPFGIAFQCQHALCSL